MQRWNHIGRFAVLPERDCHGSEWCPPEKPQRRLILGGRSGGSRPRLCVSPRVLRHKVSLRRAGLQKTQSLLLWFQ